MYKRQDYGWTLTEIPSFDKSYKWTNNQWEPIVVIIRSDGSLTFKTESVSYTHLLEKLLYQLYSISKDKEQIDFVFWGGEPMLYWDTIVTLTNKIQCIFKEKNVRLGIITNGSLFTEENTDFIIKNDITVTISHDGPGQGMRSNDPVSYTHLDVYKRQ